MKRILSAAALAVLALSLAACGLVQGLDVVGKESVASFDAVLAASGERVVRDEARGGWALLAPDHSARFLWSEDFSQSPLYDVMLELDARPFIAAGLDTGALPGNYVLNGDKLIVGTKLGGDVLEYDGKATPLSSYGHIVRLYRDSIGYHTALDHYGVELGGGNMFEWARDLDANDKDIVFVLEPGPLVAAGVDPASVEGWVFAKVPVEIDGRPAQVDKLLKPFDLK